MEFVKGARYFGLLLLSCLLSSQALAGPSCSQWYVDFLKSRVAETIKLKSRVDRRDASLCDGKSYPYFSLCLRQYVLTWTPHDALDDVELSAIVTLTALKDKESNADKMSVKLSVLDGFLLVLEKTEPGNFEISKCKPATAEDRKIIGEAQNMAENVRTKILGLISKSLNELDSARGPAAAVSSAQANYVALLKKRYAIQASRSWNFKN